MLAGSTACEERPRTSFTLARQLVPRPRQVTSLPSQNGSYIHKKLDDGKMAFEYARITISSGGKHNNHGTSRMEKVAMIDVESLEASGVSVMDGGHIHIADLLLRQCVGRAC